jgi:hypothetical protein
MTKCRHFLEIISAGVEEGRLLETISLNFFRTDKDMTNCGRAQENVPFKHKE